MPPAVERIDPGIACPFGHLVEIVADPPVDAVRDDLRHRAGGKASTGVPQAMASTITRPNGSSHWMGNSSARALTESFLIR